MSIWRDGSISVSISMPLLIGPNEIRKLVRLAALTLSRQ